MTRVRRKRNRRSGMAAVELAMVLPIFFTLVFAQLETARLGMATQILTVASREGARVAVIDGKTLSDVQSKVSGVLSASNLSGATLTMSPTNWQTAPGGTAITASLSIPYNQVSWFATPIFFGGKVLHGSATMSSERP